MVCTTSVISITNWTQKGSNSLIMLEECWLQVWTIKSKAAIWPRIVFFQSENQESGRGYTKAPEGGRDKETFRVRPRRPRDDGFDRIVLFNMFKNSSRSLFRYPTLGGLRRNGSARQCSQVPDDFRKPAADRPKKDQVLSRPKQTLVKWPLKWCNIGVPISFFVVLSVIAKCVCTNWWCYQLTDKNIPLS